MIGMLEHDMATDKPPEAEPLTGDAESGATRQIRVFADLSDMLGDIVAAMKLGGDTNASVAVLVDPWLRDSVLAEFERYRPVIEQMRKAEEIAQQLQKKKKGRKS